MNVILTDFGFAIKKIDPRLQKYNRVGTLEFYPYEMIQRNKNTGRISYDEKVDIWCIGVITYEILYGKTPFFSSNNEEATIEKIKSIDFTYPSEKYLEA